MLVALAGRIVAVNVSVSVPAIHIDDELKVIEVGTISLVTVTAHVALFPSAEAVMFALPADLAVTTPAEVTVATDVFELLQLTV